MPLTKLTTDVENVQALTDRPNSNEGMTAAEVKAVFDQAGTDIKTYINDVLTVEVDTAVTTGGGNLTTHKTSGDHDGRYYTETEIDTQVALLETKADLTTNRKLSASGDFTGTLNGYEIVEADPGLSSAFVALQADVVQRAVNVKSAPYYAVGNGIANDTAAIQAAIAALPNGGELFFPKGTYLVSDTLDFTISNIKVSGYGAIINTTVGSLEYAIHVRGALSTSYAVLGDIAVGDTTFSVSPANSMFIAAGDYIKLTTDQLYHDMAGRTYYRGEMVKVVSVNTATGVVTIEANGFILAYTVATFAPVAKKITFIENIVIEGLEINGTSTNDRQVGIQVNAVKSLSIHHCKIHNVEAGIIPKDCLYVDIYKNRIYDCYRATTGYAVSIEGVSQQINVYENDFEHNRHSFTTGGGDGVCMYLNIHHNKGKYDTNAFLNTHGNARFVVFEDNIGSDSLLGISTYSPHTTIKRNTLVNINQSAIYGIEGAVNYIITDNIIERCSIVSGDAISMSLTSTTYETSDFAICNNNMINNAVQGSAITLDPGPAKLVDASGNNVANVGYSFITIAAGTKVKANSNTLYNSSRSATNTTYGIRITNTVSASSSAIVNGNDIDKVYNGLKIDNANLAMVDANLINPTTVPYSITASFLRDGSNYPQLFEGTLVWDPGNLVDGAGETSASMTVTGLVVGDRVEVWPPYELQGVNMGVPYVYDTNAVRIRLLNKTGSDKNLGSGTWRAIGHKKQ